jgi:SAM-dependent methyltransferase
MSRTPSGQPEEGRTEIERWILRELAPRRSTTAELSYERMESQSGERLAVIYQPLDYRQRAHWHDVALVSAFARALEGASAVLDIGPGDGWPSLRIADRFDRIVGIDASPRLVRGQRRNAARLGITNVEFVEMDVLSLAFEDASFGGVTAASSIEQTGDPTRALAEVLRVLEPGGTLAMVFEDYGTYFPDSPGDEELWTEAGEGDRVVFYQARTKAPPREAKYGVFLDPVGLLREPEVARIIDRLDRDPVRLENLDEGAPGPLRPEDLGVAFFERLRPLVVGAKFFELDHLTSASLDAILADAGFVDVRHFDHRLPELRAVFDAADSASKLEDLSACFPLICEVFGAAAADRARPGPGDFVIATRAP